MHGATIKIIYYSLYAFGIPKMYSNMLYILDQFFEWPDDDSLESKHLALSILNQLLLEVEFCWLMSCDFIPDVSTLRFSVSLYNVCLVPIAVRGILSYNELSKSRMGTFSASNFKFISEGPSNTLCYMSSLLQYRLRSLNQICSLRVWKSQHVCGYFESDAIEINLLCGAEF